jgi:hypothetical protein
MKSAKEWLENFYENLHPSSDDVQFEKFIKRVQRDVAYNLCWNITALGSNATIFEAKELILKNARENVIKEK